MTKPACMVPMTLCESHPLLYLLHWFYCVLLWDTRLDNKQEWKRREYRQSFVHLVPLERDALIYCIASAATLCRNNSFRKLDKNPHQNSYLIKIVTVNSVTCISSTKRGNTSYKIKLQTQIPLLVRLSCSEYLWRNLGFCLMIIIFHARCSTAYVRWVYWYDGNSRIN